MKKSLANLLKVKSLVTISTTLVFCILLLLGHPIPEAFQTIYLVIISFYFGTQTQKKANGIDTNEQV